MSLNKESGLIRKLYLLKGYTAQKLLKEFLINSWNKQSLQRLCIYGRRRHVYWVLMYFRIM